MGIDAHSVAMEVAQRLAGRESEPSAVDPNGKWRAAISIVISDHAKKDKSPACLRAAATCLRHILNNPDIPTDENYREQIRFIADQCWERSQ